MSFAVYGETQSYVHLISASTREEAVDLFFSDIAQFGCDPSSVFNVFAVEGDKEDKELEDLILKVVEEASK